MSSSPTWTLPRFPPLPSQKPPRSSNNPSPAEAEDSPGEDRAARLKAAGDLDGHGGLGYAKCARAPQAIVCIDPYHVVRRGYWNELRTLGDPHAAMRFKDVRRSLLKAPNNLTDKQAVTLKRLKAAGVEVWRGYMLNEATRGIFEHVLAIEEGTVLIDRLLSRLARGRLQPFVRLPKTKPKTPRRDPRRDSSRDQPRPHRKRSTTRSG